MKKPAIFLAAFLCCTTALADHHMPAQPVVYGQYFSMEVTDPRAVVEAMQKYWSSPTGQKMQSSVSLSQNVANGEMRGTHSVNVFYPSLEAMDANIRLAQGSEDSAAFRRAMSKAATRVAENLFTVLISKINKTDMASPATMLFGLKVTDQAAFMKALNTLLDSKASANFPGNLFFGQIVAMGENDNSHWVSFQAASVGALLKGVDAYMKSPDFAAYAAEADDFREVGFRSVGRQVLSLEPSDS